MIETSLTLYIHIGNIQVIEPKQKVSAFIHMIAKMETIYQLPDGSGVLSD